MTNKHSCTKILRTQNREYLQIHDSADLINKAHETASALKVELKAARE